MKKFIVLILSLILSCGLVNAQTIDNYDIPIHSVSVQVADGLVPDVFGAVVVSMGVVLAAPWVAVAGGDADDIQLNLESLTPFVSTAYDYHFRDSRWNLGGELGGWHCALVSDSGKDHFHFITGTITGKFFYKPEGSCKLYCGANLGVGTLFNGEEISPLPIVQINPIGMRWGSDRIAFTAEFGVGYKGFLQIGANIGL